jgi:hypothetical protein
VWKGFHDRGQRREALLRVERSHFGIRDEFARDLDHAANVLLNCGRGGPCELVRLAFRFI